MNDGELNWVGVNSLLEAHPKRNFFEKNREFFIKMPFKEIIAAFPRAIFDY